MTSLPHLSIVAPCHNESDNLVPLVNAVREAVDPLGFDYEMVIVDDFSTDNSWEILKVLGAHDARLRALRFARNYGQSAALWAGIQAAAGSYIATLDADLQNDPKDLPRFLETAQDYDCVCGSRVRSRAGGDSRVRQLSSKIANRVRNLVTRESVSDSGCCYRVFRRECAGNLKFFKGMHRFLPTLFKLEGYRVTEIPVSHHPRRKGRSHYNVWNRVFASAYDLMAVSWMKRRMLFYPIEEDTGGFPDVFPVLSTGTLPIGARVAELATEAESLEAPGSDPLVPPLLENAP